MAYTTIDDPSAYFHIKLYNGNGSTQSITNDANAGDFKPDWIWIKVRNDTNNHNTFDTSRGVTNRLKPNTTDAEDSGSGVSVNSDGFATGTSLGDINNTGGANNYVAWQWKANGGTTASNSDGSITSTVQADTTAGFSIVTYTGTGSNATVGHGLGATPKVVIVKNRDSAGNNWFSHWTGLLSSDANVMYIAATDGEASNATGFNSTAPTSSVFSVGTNTATNESGSGFVAYCFSEVQGYSSIKSYTGNGNADGSFIYTGFKPAWIMTKRTDSAGAWNIQDFKRSPFNVQDNFLQIDSDAESSAGGTGIWDSLSNGFKLRQNLSSTNASGGTYIYLAFASSPFVSSDGVPTTAR